MPSRNAQTARTITKAHRPLRSPPLLIIKAPRRSSNRRTHATDTAIRKARSSPIRPMARAPVRPCSAILLTERSPPRLRQRRMPPPPATPTAPIQTREALRTRCTASSQRPLEGCTTPTREEAASPTPRSSRVARRDRAAPRGIRSTAPHRASIKTQRARISRSNQASQKSRNEGPPPRQLNNISTQQTHLRNNNNSTNISSSNCKRSSSSHRAPAEGIRVSSGSFRITLWCKSRQLAITINRNKQRPHPLNSLRSRN